MSNIELIMNPTIAPVYVTATNMIMPIVAISNEAIASFIVYYATKMVAIYRNFSVFLSAINNLMWKEISKTYANININYDNVFITVVMVCIIGFLAFDKYMFTHVCYNPLATKVKDMEQQINIMKKQERMRENDWELLMQSQSQGFKQLQAEFDRKFTQMDKQVKKMDKDIKKYE